MIKDIIRYKKQFYKDSGIHFGFLLISMYIFIFRPHDNNIKVFELRVWILTISFAIIALIAVFCYQSRSSSREIVKDENNKFNNFLLKNGALDEIIFYYKWNVNIGVFTILTLVTFNIIIYTRLLNNTILSLIAILPIFFVIWTISEFRYSNQLANRLTEYTLEYRKIHSK
jgi:Ca2+/Na+ antiporter